ncbi:hypothetical protein BJ165DRAFT_1316528, partial [Panaeolus papilionaceus]
LAYVEWFLPLNRAPRDPNNQLFKICRLVDGDGRRKSSIIPIELIKSSIHLFPKFGPQAPVGWTSSKV